MYEEDVNHQVEVQQHTAAEHSPIVKYLLLAVALIYVLASLYFMYTLKTRLDALDQKQQSLESAQTELTARLHSTRSELKEALTTEVGQTKQEIAQRAAQLDAQQRSAAAKLQAEQTQQGQQIAQVNSAVSNVKTDVASTKTQLEKTVADLKRATGEIDGHSVLIATNGKELSALRALGERNYVEFTIHKAKQPQRVADVMIQLKRADPKKNRYTIELTADDKTVEKKDRGANEPVQFMTAKARQPYELVVNDVKKDTIVGYLSIPKVLNGRN